MADKPQNPLKRVFKSKTATTNCGYCQLKIKVENLEKHCKIIHKKPKLASGQVTLDSMIKKPKVVDQDDNSSEDEDILDSGDEEKKEEEYNVETNNNNPLAEEGYMDNTESEKIDSDNTSKENTQFFGSSEMASVPAKIEELSKTINAIKESVDKIQANTLQPVITVPAALTAAANILPSHDHIASLTLCKTLEDILKHFTELSYNEEEQLVKCDVCCSNTRKGGSVPGIFKYEKPPSSDKDTQRKKFKNLKAHLKAHFENKTHNDNIEEKEKSEEEERKFQSRCHQVGLRIARLCYDGYKSGSSSRAFESEVMKAVLNDTDLGDLNHSRRFLEKFRSFVASEVKKRTAGFLSTRLPQTGFLPPLNIQADKGTTIHRTRQFTTVSTITPGSDSLISIIYLGQPIVKNHTGEGVADSITVELEKYGITGAQVEGGSFDGQYFNLKVPNHLAQKLDLSSKFFCSWDPLHKIGVVETHIRKDVEFAWLVQLTETCQQIYKKFNWGKNYEALVEMCEELEMKMRNLKTFSTTRFPNSVRAVFDTLIDDFKPVSKCLDNIANTDDMGTEAQKRSAEAKAMSRKILSKTFVLQLSGTADLYDKFGHVANLCQVVDDLPYERYDNVMSAVNHFDLMVQCIDHKQCLELHEDGKVIKCLWPRFHECLDTLKHNKFQGVDIKSEHEKKAYYTKLAKKDDELALSTKADEITATKLENLARRLGSDLKQDSFEESTVECIETIRKVCDLETFAVKVKKFGAVQTSHIIGEQFLRASRQITGTLENIADMEIKENFAKFLKVMEVVTKNMKDTELDSKCLIKLLLSDQNLSCGIELTLQSVVTAAVKISVESVVESLVSRYETHFDKKRQLQETHALEEMEIAENGPHLVHADKILKTAMNKYWAENSTDGVWHFCHKSSDIRTYSNHSKVVQKFLNAKPKFPFMVD